MSMTLPDRITYDWLVALDDDALLTAERSLHQVFTSAEDTERRKLGERYELMKGPATLMTAWDRWSRANTEARHRKLNPRRETQRRK